MNGLLPPESYSVNQQIPAGWSRRPGDFDGENPVRVKVSSDWDWESAEGDATTSVAWGDWDSDGDLDLAVGNSPGQNRVYVNTGVTLEIAASWSSSESDNTNSVAWGDWDGDGDLDLAVGNSPGQNRVYVNTGVTLETAASWGSSENDSTNSVAWGDWDNDGDLDLAAGNLDSPDRVYRNTGNALGTTADWSANDVTATFAVAWGDMNGDGALDLAVGIGEAPNRVYRNTGTTLDPTAAWTSAESDDTTSVAWGDWDSDGDLDLAVGNDVFPSGAANRVYANAGVTLETAAGWSSNDSDTTWSVAWGDWDGDGYLDLFFAGPYAPVVLLNTGGSLATTHAWGGITSGHPVNSGVCADFDGDGDLDVAIGSQGRNDVFYHMDRTQVTAHWVSEEEFDDTWTVEWGDWNGDGYPDLAAGNYYQPIRLYVNELLQRPMGLPESPVSPIVSRRPGNTPTAFFHSAAECLLPPVALDFVLVDEESDPARRVLVQYSTAGGGSWSPATDAGGGGLIDLAADPDGVAHLFLWDAMADGVWADDEVVLRVSVPLQASQRLPFPIQRPAMGAASPPFRVCPAADLWLALSDGVDAAVPGEGVSYALTAGNNGPNAALHAQVTATFDAALMDVTWICAGTGGGACGALSGTGDLAGTVNLPPVSSVVYTVTGTVDPEATGVLSCNAEVTSPPTFSEVDIGNNAATDDNTLTPEVDLTVGLGNNVDQVEEGESVIYLLTVSSVGPSHCPNVTVTSDFASGLDDLLWICTGTGGGSCATSGSGDVADTILLPPGSTASYAIFGTVSVASGGTLVVSATATPPAEVFEREPADNTASDSDPVVVAPPIFSDGFESGDTSQWSVSVTVSSMPRAT